MSVAVASGRRVFVRRGRRVGDWYMRWRTICGRAAVARSHLPGCAPRWYALRAVAGGTWRSIEERPDHRPKTYRTRRAAERVVRRWLGGEER